MTRSRFDWRLILPALLLTTLGVTVLRSLVPGLVVYQVSFVVVAGLIFVLFSLTDYKIFFSLNLPLYWLSLVFLVTPFIFGMASRGAVRWLQFGQVWLQPSELVKPFLLITFAVLAQGNYKQKALIQVGAWALPTLVIFWQPDLGTALVLAVAWLVTFVSQFSLRRAVLVATVATFLLAPVTWLVLKDYQRDRLLTFVNPYSDPLGRGYHVIQSVIAVGAGQFSGRGLGHGTQSQLRFLPERHTDFIFASLSEELGFIGSSTTIVLFWLLVGRIVAISRSTPDPAGRLFSLAAACSLTFQIFVNIGMNMGLAPITGITLPFLSYGGSSLVSQAVMLGILNSISRQTTMSSFQIG